MQSLLFALFLLATIPVCAQTGRIEVSRKNYSITCPKGWTIDTSKKRAADIVIRSPQSDSLDKFRENLNIVIQDLSGQNYTLQKMGEESEVAIRDLMPDVEISSSKLISNQPLQYYSLAYRAKQGSLSFSAMQRFYIKDNIGYVVSSTFESGKEADYLTVMTDMMNSFKLR